MASQRNLKATSAGSSGTIVWPGAVLSMPCAVILTHAPAGGDPVLTLSGAGSAGALSIAIADDNTGITGTGAGDIMFVVNGTEVGSFRSTGLLMPTGGVVKINSIQVVKARITGWDVPSATTTRSGFSDFTGTFSDPPTQSECNALKDHVTLLTERLAALLADLHGTAGHGLIGT